MKIKYIYSMVAGLFVMAAVSCEDKAVVAETTSDAAEQAQEAADTDEEAAAAYYVMFEGDGS